MFIAIYYFKIKSEQETQFIRSWEELTKLIYQYENSLGSRLHKKTDNEFIAYAQWPDKKTWKNAGKNLPDSANVFGQEMKEACTEIRTDHELEVISDLLENKVF